MLLHLPRLDRHGDQPWVKECPPLAGHGAEAVRDAIAASIATLPDQLRRSLTWEPSGSAQLALGVTACSASPGCDEAESAGVSATAAPAKQQAGQKWACALAFPSAPFRSPTVLSAC